MNSSQKKILCFHGFGTNADVMNFQLKQFKKEFKNFDFITPDGAVLLNKKVYADERLGKLIEDKNIYSWGSFISINHQDFYGGMKLSILKAVDMLKTQGPFHGILGFSQGSNMVNKLCDLIETGQLKLDYEIKFFIFVSGFPYQNLTRDSFLLYKTPSLHLIGLNDFIADKSLASSSQFQNPFVIYHNQGHKIPTLTFEQVKQVRQFLEQNELNLEWAKVFYLPKL